MRHQSDSRHLEFAADAGACSIRRISVISGGSTEWKATELQHAGIVILTEQRTAIGMRFRALQSMAERFSAEDMRESVHFLLNYASP
jgi:hypothetical protein